MGQSHELLAVSRRARNQSSTQDVVTETQALLHANFSLCTAKTQAHSSGSWTLRLVRKLVHDMQEFMVGVEL